MEFREVGSSIQANGIVTNYHERGSGPALVLLHGSGPGVSGWSNWRGVVEPLAEKFRVLVPDVVGFGFTERPADGVYDIKLWVSHLIGFLDATGVEKASLVGNSFGGGLSLAAALRHSDRIAAMILMGTPSGEFEQTDGLRSGWFYEPSLENMRDMLRKFPYDESCVTEDMIRSRYEISKLHGGQAAFRKLIPKPPDPAEGPAIVKGVPEKALRTIEIPSLVLHGREDRVIPLEVGVRTHRNLPNSEMHVFGKCGHWVQHEYEREFVDATGYFLGSRLEH